MTVIALLQVLLVQSHLCGNDESTSADPIGSESAGLDFIGDDISQDGDGIPERYLNLDGLPLLPPSAQERARVNQMSTERAQEAYKTILMSGGFDEMWPKQVCQAATVAQLCSSCNRWLIPQRR